VQLLSLHPDHSDELWNLLQQPSHPAEVEPRYRLLRSALEIGWRIEEPVYLRARWSEAGPRVYHFILRLAGAASQQLITVPESPEVERFVRQEGLEVVVQ
jgi:hypothetical protein